MSVVAYKDGIMAADSRAYGGKYQASPGAKAKAHRLADGTRVGLVSAVVGLPEKYLAWLAGGAKPEDWSGDKPDLRCLMVKPDGAVFLADEGLTFSGPIDCQVYAIGSGAEFALGAMAAGASAEEAVRVACRYDPHCGEPVLVLRPDLKAVA